MLYSKAIPYIEESISIMQRYPDNELNLAYEYDLLSGCYLYLGDYTEAHKQVNKAIFYGSSLASTDLANIKVGLADIYLNENRIDSALKVIRPLLYEVDSDYYDYTLAKAAKIYYRAGMIDTAFQYASKLIHNENPSYARDAYKIILSSDLTDKVPKDTLLSWISDYKNTIEEYLDRHEAESVIFQNSAYNYNAHVKERKKYEKKYHHLIIGAVSLVAIIAIIIAIVLYLEAQNRLLKLKFIKAMELIRRLRKKDFMNFESSNFTKCGEKSDFEVISPIKAQSLALSHLRYISLKSIAGCKIRLKQVAVSQIMKICGMISRS